MKFPSAIRCLAVLAFACTSAAQAAAPSEHPESPAHADISPSGPAALPELRSGDSASARDGFRESDALEAYTTESTSSVYFPRGATALTPDAMASISEHARRLKSDSDLSVALVGTVEDIGSVSFGIALAYQRTAAVADALIGMGVAPRQVKIASCQPEDDETLPCATEICRISYRRVEFKYLKSERGLRGQPGGAPSENTKNKGARPSRTRPGEGRGK